MKRRLASALVLILLFTGCGAKETPSCYEAYPAVPDFGAILGCTLLTATAAEEAGVSFYYYKAGTWSFASACAAYDKACAQMGYASVLDEEEDFYTARCGAQIVFLTPLTLSDETGEEALFVVMIGDAEAFLDTEETLP